VNAGLTEAEERLSRGLGPCEVWVAAGVYTPTDVLDIDASFVLPQEIALYGGFAGDESSREERDWQIHETILSGELGDPGDPEDNVRHVVLAADDARLDGFTVSGGYARGDFMQRNGAGVLGTLGDFTVANCVITDNLTGIGGDDEIGMIGGNGGQGAGIYFTAGALTLLDSLVIDNRTGNGGTGMTIGGNGGDGAGVAFFSGTSLVLRNVVFSGNRTGDGGFGGNIGGRGGGGAGVAIRAPVGDARIEETDFIANLGGEGGPANILGGNGGDGTALLAYAGAGDLEIVRVEVRDNIAGAGSTMGDVPGFAGQGALAFFGTDTGGLTVMNSRVEDNEAGFAGVVLVADSEAPGAPVSVVNSVIVDNLATAGVAGGMILRTNGQRALTIANTSIAGNDAMLKGGGIRFVTGERKGDAPTRIVNSIVWGNTAMIAPSIELMSDPNIMMPVQLEIDSTAVEGGCAPDPLLACGSVFTDAPGFVDLAAGDVRLTPGSPLKDVGDDALVFADETDLDADGDLTEALPLDLEGLPRNVGAAVDPGAHEIQ
jgi:hypothetical protein